MSRKPHKIVKMDTLEEARIRESIETENQVWLREQCLVLPEISRSILTRVVRKLNEHRTGDQMIRLSLLLTEQDKRDLHIALQKLGGTEDILSGEDPVKLDLFQEKMKMILTYAPDHPESIESIMEQDDFDMITQYNLNWLISHHYDKTCENPQIFLDRIVDYINGTRNTGDIIDLSEEYLNLRDQRELIRLLRILGGTDDIFDETNLDKLIIFQKKMNELLSHNPVDPQSLEHILKNQDSQMLHYLDSIPQASK